MVQPDPPVQLGEEVSIVVQPEGEPYPVEIVTGKVKGVAAFASIQGRDPGQPIGILLSEEDAVRERSKHVL